MDILYYTLALVAGCVLLYYGASWLVHGASAIATILGIQKFVVGLTLVALGTSAPELFVNVLAAFRGETGLALANVSGSNLTNLCVGFGLCAVLASLHISWRVFRTDCAFLVVSALVVTGILAFDPGDPTLPLWVTIPLLVMLALYLYSLLRRGAIESDFVPADIVSDTQVHPGEEPAGSLLPAIGLFALGVLTLYGGGECILYGAIAFADMAGLSKPLIGLTIVAASTSVPDTIASLIAARRGEREIAVGNILGSNISNVLVVLAATLLANWGPLTTTDVTATGTSPPNPFVLLDYLAVVTVSVAVAAVAAFWGRINRFWGGVLIASYVGYMSFRVFVELQ